ncbi:thiosulfate oxidation carrier complex protein SoxZ [methane-oxidizing endosymbiont of Gigantopelta aegis]|uniref:thiosulfate oxidation carrier complex protein SoxZ n=1 Tax=methane-oxidizing endosymbiont of Gigantopelta aegis TaxID=2794938 RepID=UPI0018DD85A7|nr:thiosulfate oxidation carrier complex protein SoxZ [methane-oxidizing endosymbiont of Gigantopelta aegis]
MANSSIRIRSKRRQQKAQIRILIAHPMENGRNRDPETGQFIPAHFIQELDISLNGERVIQADLSGSISKDPYFSFVLNHVKSGDLIRVNWVDNLGIHDSREHLIK